MDARIEKTLQSIHSQKDGNNVSQDLLKDTYALLDEIEIDYEEKRYDPVFLKEVEQMLRIKGILTQFLDKKKVFIKSDDPQHIQNPSLSISKPKISDHSIKINAVLSKIKIFFSKNLERIIYIFIILILAGFTLNLWIACDC